MNIVVGISDMKISGDVESQIVTYSLGAGIGVAVHDPVARVGGVLHFMLPESGLDSAKALRNPYMFADTGIPCLFQGVCRLGADKQRMKVIVVGGGQVLDQQGFLNIGERNHMAVKEIFRKDNVKTDYEDVGGHVNRTLKLRVRSGEAWIKISGRGETKI
jgi:chemotaxis protein CheD